MYPSIYDNINKNQNKVNNYNQNQNQNKQNGNQKNQPIKKYADFEIQTFFNNESNTGYSAKDMDLKSELDKITNHYMATFNNINELAKKFAQGNDNIYRANMINEDLKQIDFETGNEYGHFIEQLYDVTKKGDVTNLGYDNYKQNPKDVDQKLKKIISDYKYEVILFTNKNNDKLRNFVNEKNRKNYYYNNNNNNKNNNNSYDNPNMGPAPSQNNNYNYQDNGNQNGNNYYGNYNNNGGDYRNNYRNNNYRNDNYDQYNQRNGDNYGNNYRPNYRNNNYNYNNYSPGKISVKFVANGRESYHDFDPEDSGELIYWCATEKKNDPKIYNKNGRFLSQDNLREMRVKDVFAECEPVLNIY